MTPLESKAEARLIEQLKRRDEAAFSELVQQYQGHIYRLMFRMLGDEAEAQDMAQEVFITCFKSIESFRGDSKLSTWLYRVATNHCKNRIKYLKRRARGAKMSFDDLAETGVGEGDAASTTVARVPGPSEVVEGRQMEQVIRIALAELDPEHREVIVLRDIENLPYEEIQAVTGLAAGTVKSRLHRARTALQQRVQALMAPSRASASGETP